MTATELKSKKITLATLKSFVKKSNELFVETKSNFDGWDDCVKPVAKNFSKVSKEDAIGFKGVYCVGRSADWFSFTETDTHYGIKVSNCCGCGILWTTK